MQVDRAKAVRVEQDGQTYYLCSEHCAHELAAQRTRPPQRTHPPA